MKTRCMLLPEELWNPGAVEQWLEELAAKGWRLFDCGTRMAHFSLEEPKKCRVRLHPQEPEESQYRQERIAVYREMGWEYAAELANCYEIFYCNDPAAPELESDPIAQKWAWEKALKRSRIAGWFNLLLYLVGVAIVLYLWLESGTPAEMLIQGGVLLFLLLAVMFPWGVYSAIRQVRGVRQSRRLLDAGISLSHTGNWKTMRRKAVTDFAVQNLLWILILLRYWVPVFGHQYIEELAKAEEPLPYVASTELMPELAGEEYYDGASCQWQLLAPARYEVYEGFSEQQRTNTTFDRLRFEGLAKLLYREKLDAFLQQWPDEAEQRAVISADFDEAVLLSGGYNVSMFLARSGCRVFTVWVNYPVELEEHLDAFADILTSF